MLLRCVTRSWVASALSACQPCTCPELPPLRETRLGRGLIPRKRRTPQGPGASFPNSGQPVTWLSSCVESRAAIARSPVPGPLFARAQMFAQLMATFSGNLPPWLPASPGKRKPLLLLHASTEKGLPSPCSCQETGSQALWETGLGSALSAVTAPLVIFV